MSFSILSNQTYDSVRFSELVRFIMAYSLIISVFLLIITVMQVIAWWKIFEKAGMNGWYAIIPFYGSWKFHEVVWGKGWYMFFNLIPVFNYVFPLATYYTLGKRFGKGTGFCVGMIFIPLILSLVIAFDDSEYAAP